MSEQARCPYRPELKAETIPDRIKALPVDDRGYPVPWFVDWLDGKPEFRAMDLKKWVDAVKRRLCWVCGQPLGINLCFVAGPMCGINRTSAEPPSHYECGKWSAINCPFLANPKTVRREDDLLNAQNMREYGAGLALTRNPGVTMLWITRNYDVFPDGKKGYLIQMGQPDRVEWYANGKTATRAEIIESVETGLPALEAVARTEAGGIEALRRYQERFMRYVPA